MTMRLRVDGVRTIFGCSPVHEALRSLHVLKAVNRHPLHISWALRTRTRMSSELRAEADAFAFWYTERPLVLGEIGVSSWDDDLAALREAPVEDFAEQLIHRALMDRGLGRRIPLDVFLASPDLTERAVTRIGHSASAAVMAELVADPERCRERFAKFLSRYWRACVAPEWPGMETQLRDDIARRGQAMSRRGTARMLAELSPHIRADDQVVIRPPGMAKDAEPLELDLTEDDRILLVPSHFVWPELTAVVQRDPRQTVLIVYALAQMQREGRAPAPPDDLLKLLRSAGDPARLQVLQLLAQRPRSTRELAGLVGLTEAAVSKQLKLLADAGWVRPERQSYYVYYHLVRESLTDLARGLDHLLG